METNTKINTEATLQVVKHDSHFQVTERNMYSGFSTIKDNKTLKYRQKHAKT